MILLICWVNQNIRLSYNMAYYLGKVSCVGLMVKKIEERRTISIKVNRLSYHSDKYSVEKVEGLG